jgi:hypothetical protein
LLHRLGRSPIVVEPGGRGIGIDRRGSGVVLLADLDQADGPRESRLVRVRRIDATKAGMVDVRVDGDVVRLE